MEMVLVNDVLSNLELSHSISPFLSFTTLAGNVEGNYLGIGALLHFAGKREGFRGRQQ